LRQSQHSGPEGSVERVYPLKRARSIFNLDFVVLCAPAETEVDRRAARVETLSVLVNIARGAVVDEDAVYTAARPQDWRAALDVVAIPNAAEPERASRHPFTTERVRFVAPAGQKAWSRRWAEVAGTSPVCRGSRWRT
jgi:phosphoglycerate dehydrogenase-like enzyme